ncbi:D-3-phosphoglycerate dehydrogenase [uncultured Ruminococcus sp.]|uniref:D-3-phosphoglycerate dehydrogenase n=1 Tax=Massiliimalia timonensis TaxID=1987501 RepID=A0A8J6PF32_9FIRM|nr:phosphoglycerate dehydrogenase [Massiliimalia timonensis]MBC8611693.1 phosphoglycerate dehydrogenase [Massiliimalia timonensis]SCH59112.1 D-3-phosphoglycerate dehydrogenase [uncultured Clostridium sp.]SCH72366.1 D-3-phosphoglycerate dehydrogenase [uncultured Ruminococcus sp.]
MYQIKLLNKISPAGLENFDRDLYSWAEEMEEPDAIMVRSASMHDMELPKSVKAIARAGAGVNNIPCDECAANGVVVFNTPGANANAVKELVLLGLLISSRKVAPSMEWIKTLKGEGDQVSKLVEKGKGKFVGPEISGKALGVIGLGAIGVLVCNAASALGMKVYGYDPYLSVDAAWGLSHKIQHATSLKEIYENCDYITVHVPCNKETKGMINSESIAMMKNGVRLLNFARGELVDSADILEALDEKKVSCYVTDFVTDEQIGHPGVVAFPHLGASTPESEDNCARMAALELIDYLENGNIKNSVNMPAASMPKSKYTRLCVIHKNVPSIISKITTVLSDNQINIENMVNSSKQEMAYTMMDVSGTVSDSVTDILTAEDGIIRIRVI